MTNKLKTPSDYPQLYFRLKRKDKIQIESLVNKLVSKAKTAQKEGELQRRRNHIMTDALITGLKLLLKND